ncbi:MULTISPECIES: hypothetical protein [unclassified Pseudomonas]|uniref:hypothetical protein n=1 Tax=unclassified Pseudomonas TaxID=196821 RepID=UPI00126795FC|nr:MULTISPECIES: hypothetical protein [unclassified Pseudomonas]
MQVSIFFASGHIFAGQRRLHACLQKPYTPGVIARVPPRSARQAGLGAQRGEFHRRERAAVPMSMR